MHCYPGVTAPYDGPVMLLVTLVAVGVTTVAALAALAPVHPTGLKIGQIHLEQAEAAQYDFHRLLHHLVRELETDIVVEYLLEAEQ